MKPVRKLLVVMIISAGIGAVVFGEGMGSVSGSWYTALTFNVQSAAASALNARLTEVYRVNRLTLQGIAVWKFESGEMDFDAVTFKAGCPMGKVINIESTLVFDPNASAPNGVFDYWRTTTRFTLPGISFVHTLYITEPQTVSYQALTVRGKIGEVSVVNVTRFDMNVGHGLWFTSNLLQLGWRWYRMPVGAGLNFNTRGVQSFTIWASGCAIPGLVTDKMRLYLDLSVAFAVDKKTITPTLKLKTPWFGCVKLLSELTAGRGGPLSIDGMSIYGIEFMYRFPDGTIIKEAASLDSDKNSTITGQSDYWELVLISGESQSCCWDGNWSLATYFQATGTTLFDWGMTVFKWNMGLRDQLDLFTEITVRSSTFEGPILEGIIGGTLRW